METIDLNALKNRAYKNACEHGFHDVDYSNEHLLCLVISELMEAVAADRKGNYADVGKFIASNKASIKRTGDSGYFNHVVFDICINDTVDSELADVVIRCLDLAGLRGFDVDISDSDVICANVDYSGYKFTEAVYGVVETIFYMIRNDDEPDYLSNCINQCIANVYGLAKAIGIDLDWHINQKMRYNESRSAMHGKKY